MTENYIEYNDIDVSDVDLCDAEINTIHIEGKCIISQEEYDFLKASERLLEILESYGVDNWLYYDDAVRDWEEEGFHY